MTVNLEKFLPDAADKFADLELFLSNAEKPFSAAEIKKLRQSSDFPRSLNTFLEEHELSEAEKDHILRHRDGDFMNKSNTEKEKLRGKINKLRKIKEKDKQLNALKMKERI